MKYLINKWVVGVLLLFFSGVATAQNINLNFPTMCAPSTLCNPLLNSYSCGQGVALRTTHGSPEFYVSVINGIELRGGLNSSGLLHGEGFTLAYPFTAGRSYTIKIKHIGVPNSQAAPFPNLIAGFTNTPPRNNDGCSLGYLSLYDVNSSVPITVSSGENTASFNYAPTQTMFNLWLFSYASSFLEAALLVSAVEIIDNGVVPTGCYQDANFNFCDAGRVWNGSADVRAVNPISVGCDAFKTSTAPGAGAAFTRRFTAPTITLSPGFSASATDPNGAVRTLKIVPSAAPCTQALRVESPITNFKNEATTAQPMLENVNIYPSPSRGLVNISLNSSELQQAAITVTDQSGRIVYQMRNKSEGNLVQLNLQHLSNGIYFIKVNAQNKVTVKKVLISK